ncbi:hypothetical protein CRM22_002038 [Opisthorchis felineus]|uniref:Equilibrative nucleoside transporter 3 n=2 Tax=Opisthorchis felineus TaxID=147828 RepID=A0A4S2M824_OPIFE|nr:hypothetical protein CRM22_002038 [Opisthorchis felineus]
MGQEDKVTENVKSTPDKYNITYVIFFVAGVGCLLPWNFFCTAIPYFQYKLRNTSAKNSTIIAPDHMSHEQVLFGNYLALCSMLPLAAFTILNLFIMKWISAFIRYVLGSTIIFLMFVLTVILIRIEMNAQIFLGLTLASIVIINSAGAIVQGSLLGIASVLPSRNIRACLEGQALAGVLAALAQIASLAGASNFTTSAFAYFLIALAILGTSIIMTLMLKRNAHFKSYWDAETCIKVDDTKTQDGEENFLRLSELRSETVLEFDQHHVTQRSSGHLLKSLYEMWIHGGCAMLTLMYTLMLFPALLQPIKSVHFNPDNTWSSVFFVPVIVFLSFNVFDWIGRTLAGFVKWPRRNQRWILLAICLARVVFVPLCMFMNQQPRKHLSVVFNHDAYPIILVILLGLTNGYFLSLAMTYGPRLLSQLAKWTGFQ